MDADILVTYLFLGICKTGLDKKFGDIVKKERSF